MRVANQIGRQTRRAQGTELGQINPQEPTKLAKVNRKLLIFLWLVIPSLSRKVHAMLDLLQTSSNQIEIQFTTANTHSSPHQCLPLDFLSFCPCTEWFPNIIRNENKAFAAAAAVSLVKQLRNENINRGSCGGGKYDTNAFPIVISFSLNCTSRRNALKIFLRFDVEAERKLLRKKEMKFDCFTWGCAKRERERETIMKLWYFFHAFSLR